ncbi:MAG: hypothetical protein ABS34_02525 [Opitutaceae bacterium BACL24 MAG-120322-bin51]|jgi:hypothetical protein|nr:MAG: hypothetical protein ABS34_02525 [Opitutaceae bacterium BACL24 MAG-120322-bin51]
MDCSNQLVAITAQVMKFYTYIWMTLVAVATVRAAEPASYSVTFSTYALRALETENLYYADAPESLTKLEFRKKSRSDHYQATIQSEDGTLRIYRRNATSAKKTPAILVGRIRIEPTNVPLLLLITQGSDRTNDTINAYAIDDSQHNFPLGSIRLVNIAGIDVFAKIGTAQIALENEGISQAYTEGNRDPLGISIAAKGNNRYHLLYKNNIRITSGSRSLLILTPPTREGSIRIGGQLLMESPNEIKE